MKTSILLSVILLLINIAEPNPTENDPFSSIIILNLDRRPDRWEQTRNELVLANVESFERLSAVDGLALSQQEIDRFNVSARAARGRKILPGQVGCALSHARVMSEIVSRNLSAVLVLEDDVTFVPNFLSRLEYAMSTISKDWELLFLGSSGCIVDEADENLVVARARNCWTTHAYLLLLLYLPILCNTSIPILCNTSIKFNTFVSTFKVQSFLSILNENDCDALNIRANLNLVLLESMKVGNDNNVIQDLLFWSEKLRCAHAGEPNWREAQLHIDLAQFYALQGLGQEAFNALNSSLSQLEILTRDIENHPLLVRARNMHRYLIEIFTHDPFRDAGDVIFEFEMNVDNTLHTLEVRQNHNVIQLVENFTRRVGLGENMDSTHAILRAIYSRRAGFLGSFGGPAAKYDI